MTQKTSRGFTIVELLIVIVIIAILATITIVAYNGITARAHTSAAQAAAQTAVQKAEAYNAEKGAYPADWDAMMAAPATANDSFFLPDNAVHPVASLTAGTTPDPDKSLVMRACFSAAHATPETGNLVGNIFTYYNFQDGQLKTIEAGVTSGGTTHCDVVTP